jgi:hypothetical protein
MFIKRTKPQALSAERVSVANTITSSFGTGGLNTKDSLPSMPPEDAIILKNMIVENDRVVSRNGFESAATGFSAPIESLFEFRSAEDTQIISCAGSKIYEGLDPSVVEIASGFGSARWQGIMMNSNLLLFNGEDIPQKYDGTTLSANTLTGAGLTSSNLVGATNFKNRLITWENNACGFWYGDSDAISGALEFFDLSYITKRGGFVVACATWSYDSSGGTGLQARLVIFLSSGEAIVYEGTDPGDAELWAIVGRFKVAPPISQRALLEYSGDILLVNRYDLISFSAVFATGENPETQSKLVGAIKQVVAAYGSNFGWQLVNYPIGGLIILNVPTGNNTFIQYVINTRSGGASQFTNMNANCFVVYSDNLYFGGSDEIYQGLTGLDDNGEYINIDIQSAFSNFGVNREKSLNYVKPYMAIDNDINFNYSLNYDFQQGDLSTAELASTSGNFWDTFFWDEVFWSAESEIKSVQYGANGQGMYVGYRVNASIRNSQLAFYSILYSYTITSL